MVWSELNMISESPDLNTDIGMWQGSARRSKVGVFPELSGFLHHIRPQNANVHVFKNANCCVLSLMGCCGIVKPNLADEDNYQRAPNSYIFNGNIQSMKWVQIREPVEFTAPISGTFIPNDYTEINNKGNGDSLQFVGLFLGTLKLPPRNNRIETSPGKLGEDDASGNKEDAYAEQQNEPKIDSNKKEVEENSHTVVEVNIQVNIRKIEGTYDLLDIEGIIENGDVILSDELLVKLYKVAEHYVGPDGDINKVDEIQIEGVIQGVITQI